MEVYCSMSNQKIVTIEISMYPLVDNYEAYIIPFIKHLKSHNGLIVKTNAMSTYIQGPFKLVWDVLGTLFAESFDYDITVSNVLKIIPRKLPLEDSWLEF